MSKFTRPFMDKHPLKQQGEEIKEEIKPASEVLQDVPGYNKEINKVISSGTVNTPKKGTGTAMAAGAGLYGLGWAGYNAIKNMLKNRNEKK